MEKKKRNSSSGFWRWTIASVVFRLVLVYFPKNLRLSSRPEVSTPLTSLRRLAEGYWLKQSGMSPYAGSMYHGSPLLLSILGPLTVQRIEGQPEQPLCSLVFILADIVSAMLIRAIGQRLQAAYSQSLKILDPQKSSEASGSLPSGDVAALIYLWNPFTIVSCVGLSTSPIENMVVILALYGACTTFGWIMATHLSLYPAIIVVPFCLSMLWTELKKKKRIQRRRRDSQYHRWFIPWHPGVYNRCFNNLYNGPITATLVITLMTISFLDDYYSPYIFLYTIPLMTEHGRIILLLGYGPDAPPRKVFLQAKGGSITHDNAAEKVELPDQSECQISFSSKQPVHFLLWSVIWGFYILVLSGASVRQYGGLFEMLKRYFFAEVFDFFRSFFLIVFHVNILFMIVPLAIRLNHRPAFLAFVYIAVYSMFKSYPSVGDSALFMGLVALFINELSGNWKCKHFATGMAYACLQIILIVESVSSILNHDRLLTKLATQKLKKAILDA